MKNSDFTISLTLFAALISLTYSTTAQAWREDGHYTVCEIGYKLANQKTQKILDRYFEGQPYAVNCTWPDHVRKTEAHKHTYFWHFINIEDGGTYFDKLSPKGDALQAIYSLQDFFRDNKNKITDPKTPIGKFTGKVRESLKFLGHFIGDIHQPLHVGRLTDFGGNKIPVKWNGQSDVTYQEYKLVHGGHVSSETKDTQINLHKAVDHWMIKKYSDDNKFKADETESTYKVYAKHLMDGKSSGVPKASKELIENWQSSDPYEWVGESYKYRKEFYAVEKSMELSKDFYNKNIKTANLRILQAGVRLAGVLDNIFNRKSKISKTEKEVRSKIKKLLKNPTGSHQSDTSF